MAGPNPAPGAEEPRLGELLEFPARLTFRFIAEASAGAPALIAEFFRRETGAEAEVAAGRRSKSGRYVTYNVTAEVASAEILYGIYRGGAELPGVLHVL